jgi:hypothetical protein
LKERKDRLSFYTHTVVVAGWEADAMNYPELNGIYQEIFSKATGSRDSFYTEKEWNALHLPVKYVPYKGHHQEWHYAAKLIQEMVNIVRIFNLMDQFHINNKKGLQKSYEGIYAGWLTLFRMQLSVPLVRNVWEQYKYRHMFPKFSAWVRYFITDVLDDDPKFFDHNKTAWEHEMNQYRLPPSNSTINLLGKKA